MEGYILIELKSVSGSLGSGNVENVSVRLPNGKTYGVFSPCYADSVALLSLISGARTPTGGTVLVGGFDLHREAKQARRGIGYLPARLLPDEALTPIEYLMAIADARELPYEKTLRHVHEFLELADLAGKKECLISNLSGGEKRALCLLQLLLGNPETLVLTSPLSGLTPKEAQKIRSLIAYFSQTHTVFLCTPSTRDLTEMCDEILVLKSGTLKTVVSANDESLKAELSAPLTEASPAPEAEANAPSSNRARAILKLLMQKGGDCEVLDTDEKEDKS